MARFVGNLLGLCLGLAGIAALIWLAWRGLHDISATAALATLSSLIAVGAGLWTFFKTKEKENEARLFSEKSAVYTEVFEVIKTFSTAYRGETRGGLDTKEFVRRMTDIQYRMLVWSSAKAIRALSLLGTSDDDVDDLFAKMAYIYGSLRRDLGHKDSVRDCIDMLASNIIANERHMVREAILRSAFYREVLVKDFPAPAG